ncbi:hypothetical protein LTS15_006587 [Exophiala xenobiotica]|nr:hypothetical protein LTS15_006587 [Exophiala xenobiotica]
MEPMQSPPEDTVKESTDSSAPTWTYPPRTCRLCLEDVYPTVTLYPPGVPARLQHPLVEYKNDDEYGRLIKPCRCKGGMRYIHELCLRRSRTEVNRPNSLWKCHECGHQFNFKRLTIQRYLGSRVSSGILTLLVMVFIMFFLGFVADPILNFYTDPYETLLGHEELWQEVTVNESEDTMSGWLLHFTKGLVSMGVLSFLRTMILNPFQWWNLRNTGFVSSRVSGRAPTGRNRAVNISWIVIVMGVFSAAWLFYQWVQAIIGRWLQRIGNNIVDTQLPGDDDDLKPPANWKYEPSKEDARAESRDSVPLEDEWVKDQADLTPESEKAGNKPSQVNSAPNQPGSTEEDDSTEPVTTRHSIPGAFTSATAYSSAVDEAQHQGWSFSGI